MGPLLFLLYINELSETVKIEPDISAEDNEMIIYADDNTPITAHKDPDVLEVKLQNIANLTTDWFKRNDMVCSGDKTKLLILGTSASRANKLDRQEKSLKVQVSGNTTTESKSERLLGVVVNVNCTWKNHLYGGQ